MKVVCDLDGTLNADPELYRGELRGLMERGHEVHILTGDPMAQHLLAQLGFVKNRDFTCVAVIPRKNIAATKVAYMKRVGATTMIDNRKKNIKAARRAGFTCQHHLPPKKKD